MSEKRRPKIESRDLTEKLTAIRQTHGAALRRLTRGYERDPERARDLEQEILTAIWRSLPSFRGESSLRTWVFRVAHNVSITHIQKAQRDAVQQALALDDLDGPRSAELEHRIFSRDLLERIHLLLDALGPLDREVMMLHLEGLPQKDIAEICGISTSHVSTKIHRIRVALSGLKEEHSHAI